MQSGTNTDSNDRSRTSKLNFPELKQLDRTLQADTGTLIFIKLIPLQFLKELTPIVGTLLTLNIINSYMGFKYSYIYLSSYSYVNAVFHSFNNILIKRMVQMVSEFVQNRELKAVRVYMTYFVLLDIVINIIFIACFTAPVMDIIKKQSAYPDIAFNFVIVQTVPGIVGVVIFNLVRNYFVLEHSFGQEISMIFAQMVIANVAIAIYGFICLNFGTNLIKFEVIGIITMLSYAVIAIPCLISFYFIKQRKDKIIILKQEFFKFRFLVIAIYRYLKGLWQFLFISTSRQMFFFTQQFFIFDTFIINEDYAKFHQMTLAIYLICSELCSSLGRAISQVMIKFYHVSVGFRSQRITTHFSLICIIVGGILCLFYFLILPFIYQFILDSNNENFNDIVTIKSPLSFCIIRSITAPVEEMAVSYASSRNRTPIFIIINCQKFLLYGVMLIPAYFYRTQMHILQPIVSIDIIEFVLCFAQLILIIIDMTPSKIQKQDIVKMAMELEPAQKDDNINFDLAAMEGIKFEGELDPQLLEGLMEVQEPEGVDLFGGFSDFGGKTEKKTTGATKFTHDEKKQSKSPQKRTTNTDQPGSKQTTEGEDSMMANMQKLGIQSGAKVLTDAENEIEGQLDVLNNLIIDLKGNQDEIIDSFAKDSQNPELSDEAARLVQRVSRSARQSSLASEDARQLGSTTLLGP